MASANDYNRSHWTKKIPKYLSEDWSTKPSPFAQEVAKHLSPDQTLLELGTGAGQDGLWLAGKVKKVVLSDGHDVAFDEIRQRAKAKGILNLDLQTVDITKVFPFDDSSFDVVYAQLVLHYFDDETMHKIMSEIKRVLRPGGLLACMVNSIKDEEYNPDQVNDDGLILVDGLIKRYFDEDSFEPFVEGFEAVLLDSRGKTPKDDAVSNSGMVRFIGKKD